MVVSPKHIQWHQLRLQLLMLCALQDIWDQFRPPLEILFLHNQDLYSENKNCYEMGILFILTIDVEK